MHPARPYPGLVHVWAPPQQTMMRGIGIGMRRTAMALIASVVPNFRIRTMQQARYHLTVKHISRGHLSGVDDGAEISVASMILPVPILMPLDFR